LDQIASQKRSLWVALAQTKPQAIDGDILAIGFAHRRDAEILKKPQGPGNPLTNADLLRDLIFPHAGLRVRFTVSDLSPDGELAGTGSPEPVAFTEAQVGSSEPLEGGSSTKEKEDMESAVGFDPQDKDGVSQSIASRGEPVVRQLLGGELVSEEFLESLPDDGAKGV